MPQEKPDYTEDDVDTAAAVFAKFATLLNPQVDEYHAYTILREFIFTQGMHLDNVEEVVEFIRSTFFDPKRDTMH